LIKGEHFQYPATSTGRGFLFCGPKIQIASSFGVHQISGPYKKQDKTGMKGDGNWDRDSDILSTSLFTGLTQYNRLATLISHFQ
jgi:hypothetical protein